MQRYFFASITSFVLDVIHSSLINSETLTNFNIFHLKLC